MRNEKFCLGIETTAHTFGVSVVTFSGKILSNVKDTFSTDEGGMIPAQVADHHVNLCYEIAKKAIVQSKISIDDISLIAYSNSPGMGHTLKIGRLAAEILAQKYNLPLIGVNHCIAHLEIGRLCATQSNDYNHKKEINIQDKIHPTDPILLYCSGANTQVISYEAGKYRIFGETLDIGVGNFLDAFARNLDLGFPGGPKIEQLALQSDNTMVDLPYSVKGMDVSFGGILTNLKTKIKSAKYKREDLCYSAQENAFAMLIEVAERALAHCDKKELLLGGGVACNKRLQEMASVMCEERGAKCYVLENQFNVDNAAMIAWTGILMFTNLSDKKRRIIYDDHINPYERTDDVLVYWR